MKLDLDNLRFLSVPKNVGNSRQTSRAGCLYKSGYFRFTSAVEELEDGHFLDIEINPEKQRFSFRLNGDDVEIVRRGFWVGTKVYQEFAKRNKTVSFKFPEKPDENGWFHSL